MLRHLALFESEKWRNRNLNTHTTLLVNSLFIYLFLLYRKPCTRRGVVPVAAAAMDRHRVRAKGFPSLLVPSLNRGWVYSWKRRVSNQRSRLHDGDCVFVMGRDSDSIAVVQVHNSSRPTRPSVRERGQADEAFSRGHHE